MRSHVRGTGAALLAMMLAACSSSSSGPAAPKDHTHLVARLLSKATAPSQLDVTFIPDFNEPDSAAPSASSPRPLDCSQLIGVARVFGADPDAVPVDQASVILAWHEPGQPLGQGTEFIYRYAPGGATKALADARALVGRCPTSQDNDDFGSITYTFSLTSGPALGDESLDVRTGSNASLKDDQNNSYTVVKQADTVVVRSGDVLIVIDELGREASQTSHVDAEMNAAWKAYTGG